MSESVKEECTCIWEGQSAGSGTGITESILVERSNDCPTHGLKGCLSCESVFSGSIETELTRAMLIGVTGGTHLRPCPWGDQGCRFVIHEQEGSTPHWVCLQCRFREDLGGTEEE